MSNEFDYKDDNFDYGECISYLTSELYNQYPASSLEDYTDDSGQEFMGIKSQAKLLLKMYNKHDNETSIDNLIANWHLIDTE